MVFEPRNAGPELMTPKKRQMPKPKAVIRKDFAQGSTIRSTELAQLYTELVRLRQAVRQAELLARRAKVGFNLH
jgi:hypothetical protein